MNKIQKGCDGSLKLGTKEVGLIDNFSLSINYEGAEITSIGELWKQWDSVGKDWSGSFSATFDADEHKDALDAILSGTGADIAAVFKCGANVTISGNIKLNSSSINVSKGSLTSISFNFNGNGAPSITYGDAA